MAFVPKIIVEYNKDTKAYSVQDVTGLYDVSTNPNGWGAPNPERNAAGIKAVLKIYYNKEPLSSIDLTNLVTPAILDDIDFGELFQGITEEDGVYTFGYFIELPGQDPYIGWDVNYLHENIKKLVSEHWFRLSSNKDIYKRKALQKECIELEGYISGIAALHRQRGNEDRFLNLLFAAEKQIKVNQENNLI
jgi:hypothetical protein